MLTFKEIESIKVGDAVMLVGDNTVYEGGSILTVVEKDESPITQYAFKVDGYDTNNNYVTQWVENDNLALPNIIIMEEIPFSEAMEVLYKHDGKDLYVSADWLDEPYTLFPAGRKSLQKLLDLGFEDILDLHDVTWHKAKQSYTK
ncbi:hypothetical protein [Vagococcus salmoninarum]|uniref:hypothetical protein n=1 Tax=Vagococcus salmoninarum TaxID=2739 RepID=UPI0028D4BC78|nr:hypothetical protein [Vagococcus salmoninarum]